MQIIESNFNPPQTYPLEHIGSKTQLLFFDIETTGFSGLYSNVYLIGCVYYKHDSWHLIQWFADTAKAEVEILSAFFEFTKAFKMLVHFNGDRFDIPFLLKRCQHHQIGYNFSHLSSFDIYRKIKPYGGWLGLPSLKQKAIEVFLNIKRQDLYSGGELIEVYQHYLCNHREDLYDLLILHNADDLKGMTAILPILSYADFFESNFRFHSQQIEYDVDLFGDTNAQLQLLFESDASLPSVWNKNKYPIECTANGSHLYIKINLYKGMLKYFYSNYRDYYYLPFEDTAIHKSVGEYVEKNARQKATAQTCYVKKQGLFLPQLQTIWEPAFKHKYKDSISYVEYQANLFDDAEKNKTFINWLLLFMSQKDKKE